MCYAICRACTRVKRITISPVTTRCLGVLSSFVFDTRLECFGSRGKDMFGVRPPGAHVPFHEPARVLSLLVFPCRLARFCRSQHAALIPEHGEKPFVVGLRIGAHVGQDALEHSLLGRGAGELGLLAFLAVFCPVVLEPGSVYSAGVVIGIHAHPFSRYV